MSEVNAWLGAGDPVAVATVISTWGSAPRPAGSRMAISQAGKIAGSVSGGRRDGVFLEPFPRPPELFIFGGSHVAIPLTRFADILGFRVTVVDARSKFAGRGRFPEARQVIHAWPDEVLKELPMDGSTYVVILTHDPKFDDPTITAALRGRPRYIGAIGSKKTHRERVARLTAAGVDPGSLTRVHAPIGLDLGAQTAEETALAILSQMVAVRHGKQGGPMPGLTAGSERSEEHTS